MSRISRLAAALLVGMSVSLSAELSRHDFEGYKFSLQLPTGYALQADASPRQGFKTFGFATEPRGDGTRGMIQVSLLDFSRAPAGETVSLEKFAAAMINGVRDRRSRWEQTVGDLKVDGVPAKRIEWAGSMEPGFGRPPVNMRGVMIVGIKKNLGFALHTQDVVAFTDVTLPTCEQALQTFAMTLRR
ncbi:MAG: hypothetical protein ND807_12090 [Vicinamibacterales bacterium]|nr:hypothetical protein [Vicinamibacterales bacterium]